MPRKKKDLRKNNHRPYVLTAEKLVALRTAFSQGFTVINACLFAGISDDAYYNYCDRNKNFKEECKRLQKSPIFKAIKNINDAIDSGDVNTSKWLLERKCREEYSIKTESEHVISINPKITYIDKEEKEFYENHIKEITGKSYKKDDNHEEKPMKIVNNKENILN